MDLTRETHVAKIATRHPGTIRVFQRHGIDFCCGGKRPLAEACTEHGLKYETLREELAIEMAGRASDERDWDEATLTELIDHVVSRYHPSGACTTFRGLYHGLAELEADTHQHIHLENNVLFPRAQALEADLTGIPA